MPLDRIRTAAIPMAAVAAVAALGAAGAFAKVTHGGQPKYTGYAIASRHGFHAEWKQHTASVTRIRIRFDSGVRVAFRPSKRSQLYAGYTLAVNGKTVAGNLRVPPGRASGVLNLTSVPEAGLDFVALSASLRTGDRPSIVLTGFPPTTSMMVLQTAGAGVPATRVTAPCRRNRQQTRGSMLITLTSREHERGLVDNGLACGHIK